MSSKWWIWTIANQGKTSQKITWGKIKGPEKVIKIRRPTAWQEIKGMLSPTLCESMDCSPPDSSVHGDSPGKNAGVGCHALLQGIFLIQGWTSVFYILCIGRRVLYHQHQLASPKLLLGSSRIWTSAPSPWRDWSLNAVPQIALPCWQWSEVAQSCPTLCDTMDCSLSDF